ncbi:hypothetical protein D3C87_1385330 [compost metagenome]
MDLGAAGVVRQGDALASLLGADLGQGVSPLGLLDLGLDLLGGQARHFLTGFEGVPLAEVHGGDAAGQLEGQIDLGALDDARERGPIGPVGLGRAGEAEGDAEGEGDARKGDDPASGAAGAGLLDR